MKIMKLNEKFHWLHQYIWFGEGTGGVDFTQRRSMRHCAWHTHLQKVEKSMKFEIITVVTINMSSGI